MGKPASAGPSPVANGSLAPFLEGNCWIIRRRCTPDDHALANIVHHEKRVGNFLFRRGYLLE
jgi:hypothetical protein